MNFFKIEPIQGYMQQEDAIMITGVIHEGYYKKISSYKSKLENITFYSNAHALDIINLFEEFNINSRIKRKYKFIFKINGIQHYHLIGSPYYTPY